MRAPEQDPTVATLQLILVGLLALMIFIGIYLYGETAAVRYQSCHGQETHTGIATTWTPWDGCHATILGTDLKVGP